MRIFCLVKPRPDGRGFEVCNDDCSHSEYTPTLSIKGLKAERDS